MTDNPLTPPPPGYTTTPPTEEGWYKLASWFDGHYSFRLIHVHKTDDGKLVYWSTSGARWGPVLWISDWWGPRIEFP